ncbi:unnamed protein product [Blepharisma stoltei]|uniref:Uncharacterized protein n=1 Tax=Blepharisma stoltei TaxID=1481888 RepID=A0AAU9JZ68_9CILI|nr:unnamed protein product [Blepharisma stoltei]
MASLDKLQKLDEYEKKLRQKAVTQPQVMRRMQRDYKYFMNEEDAKLFADELYRNQMRLAISGVIGVLLSAATWRSKISTYPSSTQVLFRVILLLGPFAYAIETSPTQRFLQLNDQLYIKYYKPVMEQMLKEP